MTSPSDEEGSVEEEYHLSNGDCFLGILKLPPPPTGGTSDGSSSHDDDDDDDASNWWKNNHINSSSSSQQQHQLTPKLIYAKRFGTPQNSEACSSLLALPNVNDALLHSSSQLKLVLLGHVNPVELSEAELEKLEEELGYGGEEKVGVGSEFDVFDNSSGESGNNGRRGLLEQKTEESQAMQQEEESQQQQHERSLEQPEINQGGFFTSLSSSTKNGALGGPLTHNGRAYGFLIDFDVSLTPTEEFEVVDSSSTSPTINDFNMNNAYGALLGGYVLESSPLVYPIDLTQNVRDPNQLYVVSMHSDNEKEVYNSEYVTSAEEEVNAELHSRPDVTLGGAGGATTSGGDGLFVGGVPKYGSNFYVKVEQVTITPYEQLLNVKPTLTEHVKQTMQPGWGFGFKLNDATDVRPSCVEFVKGRTIDEDLLLMGGTTRKVSKDGSGGVEYDGFITKLIPPAPAPVMDMTSGATLEEAEAGNNKNSIQNEGTHPTKRIDSTTGRDETVTAICLPPPDVGGMGVTHAFVIGSSTNPERGASGPSMAYLLKMRLDDMSTVWKQHVPSISVDGGVGGDVLGQGCTVSHDGKVVYLSGTIDGTSGMRTGAANADVKPLGGVSDVFVVAYDAEFGNVKWEQQLGTKYEDKLARGGGIKVDNDGNVMIMGSSRGALQRSRDGNGRMSSDIFFMNLSRENGAYINAPFTTDGSDDSTSKAAASTLSSSESGSGNGVLAGIVIAVAALISALLIIVVRRRRKVVRKEVTRMWDRNNGDDFSYNDNPSPTTIDSGDEDRTSSGALRIVRGGVDDGWDDGSDRINRGSLWKRVSGGSEKSSPKRLITSYTKKESEDDASFLAKLREEASSSSKRLSNMVNNDATATDPRLDGGASIKNLLSQYREVKKGSIISSDGKKSSLSSGNNTPNKGTLNKRKAVPPPPPPPPPRRNYEGDGLSEFTIV